MTVLLALFIAVVAFSLMLTVLVASTRPLRAYDLPIFTSRQADGAGLRHTGPHWMDLQGARPLRDATIAPRPPERHISALPLPAPVISDTPEISGSRVVPHPVPTPAAHAPRASRRVNPNTWGRVRSEVGTLKTMRGLS
jgi:hypothetical protein